MRFMALTGVRVGKACELTWDAIELNRQFVTVGIDKNGKPHPAAPRFVDRPEGLPAPGDFAALSGMEIMRGVLSSRLPVPPICRTVGFRRAEISEGRAVFDGAPRFGHFRALSL